MPFILGPKLHASSNFKDADTWASMTPEPVQARVARASLRNMDM